MARLVQNWKARPDRSDYTAAENYLSLLMPQAAARDVARRLGKAPLVLRKAKDLLRASGLPVLAAENIEVADKLRKVKEGKKLSPVLLVRGRLESAVPLTIADGYHRICASYHLEEGAEIPCRIVDLGRQAPPGQIQPRRR